MQAANFELFMCCLGSGTTLCNKAVTEHGDYKTIGRISNAGNIKLYVKPDYLPAEAAERIKSVAAAERLKFLDDLELWIKHDPLRIYEKMLDVLSASELLKFIQKDEGATLTENIQKLIPVFLERS